MKMPHVGVYMPNGYIRYTAFNIGDRVRRTNVNGEVSYHTIREINVYPATDYVFVFWLEPSIGFAIPEDELEEAGDGEED